jgi:predicted membrane protein
MFITVPDNADVTIKTEVSAGGYKLFGREGDFHWGNDQTNHYDGCEGAKKLTLNLRTGGGYIEVNRANGKAAATCKAA